MRQINSEIRERVWISYVGMRREEERQRQRDRETERQNEIQRERETERETEQEREKKGREKRRLGLTRRETGSLAADDHL